MRPTRHRRRFHTDRIVKARRARYLRETNERAERAASNHEEWIAKRLSYGRLAVLDPWDCGSSCFMCHYDKLEPGQRTRAKRAWQRDWL